MVRTDVPRATQRTISGRPANEVKAWSEDTWGRTNAVTRPATKPAVTPPVTTEFTAVDHVLSSARGRTWSAVVPRPIRAAVEANVIAAKTVLADPMVDSENAWVASAQNARPRRPLTPVAMITQPLLRARWLRR